MCCLGSLDDNRPLRCGACHITYAFDFQTHEQNVSVHVPTCTLPGTCMYLQHFSDERRQACGGGAPGRPAFFCDRRSSVQCLSNCQGLTSRYRNSQARGQRAEHPSIHIRIGKFSLEERSLLLQLRFSRTAGRWGVPLPPA